MHNAYVSILMLLSALTDKCVNDNDVVFSTLIVVNLFNYADY